MATPRRETARAVKKVKRSAVSVLPRIEIANFVIEENGHKYTAVDVAKEAARLQQAVEGAQKAGVQLSQRMILLAGKCGEPDVFRALMLKTEQEMGWGPANPVPGTWRTLKSTIFRSWKDLGVVPGARLQIPIIRDGRVVRNPKTGKPQQTRMLIGGINQLKSAAKAIRTLRKAEQPGGEPAESKVAPTTEPMPDKKIHALVLRVTHVYERLNTPDKKRMLGRLGEVAEEFEAEAPRAH